MFYVSEHPKQADLRIIQHVRKNQKIFGSRGKIMSDDMARKVSVADSEILDAFDVSPSPITTVSDLNTEIDLEPDSIRFRLKRLEDQGRVKSKKVGARATVWWRVETTESPPSHPA